MKFLDNKAPQVEFDNIHVLIISVRSTNKTEHIKVNGYGAIADNDESANYFYIVCFTYVPWKLKVAIIQEVP